MPSNVTTAQLRNKVISLEMLLVIIMYQHWSSRRLANIYELARTMMEFDQVMLFIHRAACSLLNLPTIIPAGSPAGPYLQLHDAWRRGSQGTAGFLCHQLCGVHRNQEVSMSFQPQGHMCHICHICHIESCSSPFFAWFAGIKSASQSIKFHSFWYSMVIIQTRPGAKSSKLRSIC